MVVLREIDVDDGVDYFKLVLRRFEGNEDPFVVVLFQEFPVDGITPTTNFLGVFDGFEDKFLVINHCNYTHTKLDMLFEEELIRYNLIKNHQ